MTGRNINTVLIPIPMLSAKVKII